MLQQQQEQGGPANVGQREGVNAAEQAYTSCCRGRHAHSTVMTGWCSREQGQAYPRHTQRLTHSGCTIVKRVSQRCMRAQGWTSAQHRTAAHPPGTPDHSGGSYVPAALGGWLAAAAAAAGAAAAPLAASAPAAASSSPPPAPVASAAAGASCCSLCWCAASTACWMALSRCPGVTVAAATAAMAAALPLAPDRQGDKRGRCRNDGRCHAAWVGATPSKGKSDTHGTAADMQTCGIHLPPPYLGLVWGAAASELVTGCC